MLLLLLLLFIVVVIVYCYRFNCISMNSKIISKAIGHCDTLLFRVYGKELEQLQSHYEQHKVSGCG